MKIYTKTGDRGATSLAGGERVAKWDLRVEAYGAVDELMADVAMLADVLAGYEEGDRFGEALSSPRPAACASQALADRFPNLSPATTAPSYVAQLREDALHIVETLMTVAGIFAQGGRRSPIRDLDPTETTWLEERIDAISAGLAPLKTFTLPGGHVAVSMANVCRTVCRRAERAAHAANEKFGLPPGALAYLNRLSDYFYVAGRKLSEAFNVKEKSWVLEK